MILADLAPETRAEIVRWREAIRDRDQVFLRIDVVDHGRRFDVEFWAGHHYRPKSIIRPHHEWVAHDGSVLYFIGRKEPLWSSEQILARCPGSFAFLESIPKSMKGKQALRGDDFGYLVPASDVALAYLAFGYPRSRTVWTDEAVARAREIQSEFDAATQLAVEAAEFKGPGAVLPDGAAELPDPPEDQLSPYQRAAAALALRARGGYLLTMDRGTGKTATAITVSCEVARRTRDRGATCLVICPNQVRLNWVREIERFATVRCRVATVRGTKEKRARLLAYALAEPTPGEMVFVIVGQDTAPHDLASLIQFQWDLLLIDECHNAKNSRTRRWKTLQAIRKRAARALLLTGTPVANSFVDLWAQLELAREFGSGTPRFDDYKTTYGRWRPLPELQGVSVLTSTQNVPMLRERLARMTFAITKDEAGLHLPPKTREVLEIEMTDAQASAYEQLTKELRAEIEDDEGNHNSIWAEHILTKLLRLAQVTSGFFMLEPSEDPVEGETPKPSVACQIDGVDENPKIRAAIELHESREPGSKIVFFATFREDCRALHEALESRGAVGARYDGSTPMSSREEIVDRFNGDDSFSYLVANPRTAGEGLNLLGYDPHDPERSQSYADQCVFFSSSWSIILRLQAEDRLHRRGTRMPVRITDLIVPETIDEEILRALLAKERNAATLTDVRGILERLNMTPAGRPA